MEAGAFKIQIHRILYFPLHARVPSRMPVLISEDEPNIQPRESREDLGAERVDKLDQEQDHEEKVGE